MPQAKNTRTSVNTSTKASTSAPRKSARKTSDITPIKKLVLRARAMMGERGVRSVSALQRSLSAIGVAISVPQLIRVIDGDAKHINKDVIEGMLTVLDCTVSDLFVTTG